MYCIDCQEKIEIELEERSLKVKGGVSVLKKEEEIRKEKEKRAKNFYLDGRNLPVEKRLRQGH
jgi:hypothetical protein